MKFYHHFPSSAQRREEFQRMIHQVHQQVPQASVEAIRHDLGQYDHPSDELSRSKFFIFFSEKTKDIQKTIASLKERALAAARAANRSTSSTSSGAINKSANGYGHRQTYERLKEELIEKNRQLFLQKNSN